MSTAERPEAARRAAALGALSLVVGAVAFGLAAVAGDAWRLVVLPILLLGLVAATFTAATRRGLLRLLASTVAVALLVALSALVLTAENSGIGLLVVLALVAAATALARYALRRDTRSLKALDVPGEAVPAARHGVLILNLRSGGGKAERFGLVEECGRRGIEPVVLQPGDDLVALAKDAVARGADALGVAGGDGTQALVASVAMAAGVPVVCVPAGTRNHFALDLGLDRTDVVGALDAFGDAVERQVDIAEVNGRVFVNNVSLGVYAKIVQSPGYREAKRRTTKAMLPELLGKGAAPFDLRFAGPDGTERRGAQVVQVSNNPYVLTSFAGFGSRARLDTGTLGIAIAEVHGAADVAAFVAAETTGTLARFHGFDEWTTTALTVDSAGPVEAGIDGEALVLDPPLEFRILPGALRVRLPRTAPGYSPAALRSPAPWWTLSALVRVAAGHTAPIDEALR